MCSEYIGNSTIVGSLMWSDVAQTLVWNISCGDPSSIRPDVGGSPIPWPLTLMSLLLHLPAVIIRVAQWEDALTWSLVLTGFEVFLVLMSFISSRLAPEKVMVWSTIVPVISAGVVLQQFVLLVEEYKLGLPLKRRAGPNQVETNDEDRRLLNPHLRSFFSRLHQRPPSSTDSTVETIETGDIPKERPSKSIPAYKKFLMIAFVVLFYFIIALQIRGLVAALEGHRNARNLEVSWCSPVFSTFSVAVLDGNCRFHLVHQSGKKGVGCIKISAQEQKTMLVVIIVLDSFFLIVEAVDFVILVAVNSEFRWRQVKMKRPWATTFSGVLGLLAVLAFGVAESFRLPPGITEQVWVVLQLAVSPSPPEPSSELRELTAGLLPSTGAALNSGIELNAIDTTFRNVPLLKEIAIDSEVPGYVIKTPLEGEDHRLRTQNCQGFLFFSPVSTSQLPKMISRGC
ncbi:MAG: hypothetical protein M1839_001748 [Geoglossum umbratile]|nr:MAG: hypothetical protein M1839_001748 [Geoglossum umbratile]